MTTYQGRLASGQAVNINVTNTKISLVEKISTVVDLPFIFPVLVDLQQNGALGLPFNNAHNENPEKFENVFTHLRSHGVGRILPTFTTAPPDQLCQAVANLHKYINNNPELISMVPGFFLEAMFISPHDGWRGAHPLKYVKPADYNLFKTIDQACDNNIRIVNVAPEEPGALEFISKAVADNKRVSLGHCNPNAKIIKEAVSCGASMITHFANGAAATVPRHRNPFWPFLSENKLSAGLICDGFHLPPEVVDVVLKVKGKENCWIVSDACGCSGMPCGKYDDSGLVPFIVEPEGLIHLPESKDILAGNWFQQDRSVEFLVKNLSFSLPEAWEQCSNIPARLLGIDLPQIKINEEASFVLARWDNGLIIEQAVYNGKPYLKQVVTPLDVVVTT